MNQEVKEKWLKALRSGEYKQGVRRLKHKDQYCCLGVLCDLHGKETGNAWCGEFYCGSFQTLPTEVMDWAGLKSENPFVGLPKSKEKLNADFREAMYLSLATLNDEGYSFEDIANEIEGKL